MYRIEYLCIRVKYWLEPELEREDAMDALEALASLASTDDPVTHERLLALVDRLNERSTGP